MGVQHNKNLEVLFQLGSLKQLMRKIVAHHGILDYVVKSPSLSSSSPSTETPKIFGDPQQVPKLELDRGNNLRVRTPKDQNCKVLKAKETKRNRLA
jgi:hypothetical protein